MTPRVGILAVLAVVIGIVLAPSVWAGHVLSLQCGDGGQYYVDLDSNTVTFTYVGPGSKHYLHEPVAARISKVAIAWDAVFASGKQLDHYLIDRVVGTLTYTDNYNGTVSTMTWECHAAAPVQPKF